MSKELPFKISELKVLLQSAEYCLFPNRSLFFNRTYELAVHGGTPFEKGVAVDPSIARRGGIII